MAAEAGVKIGVQTPRFERVTVHLVVLGQDCDVDARVRTGTCQPTDVIPFAHQLTDAITDAVVRDAAARGSSPSCAPGCAACCRMLAPIAPVEALALARLVKAMPGKQREIVRRRFGAAVRRLEEIGLLDRAAPPGRTQLTADATRAKSAFQVAAERYVDASIACPFLEAERCSIHADRPVACRQHIAVSPPELCRSDRGDGAEVLPRPVWMAEVLSELTAERSGHDPKALPLPLALEWAEVYAEDLEFEAQGSDLCTNLVERMAVSE